MNFSDSLLGCSKVNLFNLSLRGALVSLWALPHSETRRGLPGTVSSGSGVGSMQSVPRLPTVVTPNLSIEGTVKRLRLLPAPHVKR